MAELHSQSIDAAMDLIKKVPDFRWTLDGSWVAEQYLNGRTSQARAQFLEHVRNGSIVIPPEFANLHTGNASWEGLARSLYDQHRLAQEYKLPAADAAQIVDVPSYTWGYSSVLHDAGIKYLIAASNSWRAPVMLLGKWNEKSPFYWEGPDGSRVMMWYSRAYLQAHTLFGSPWRMEVDSRRPAGFSASLYASGLHRQHRNHLWHATGEHAACEGAERNRLHLQP